MSESITRMFRSGNGGLKAFISIVGTCAMIWAGYKVLEARVDGHDKQIIEDRVSNLKRFESHEKRMDGFQMDRNADRELLIRLDERSRKQEETLNEILEEVKRK